MPGSLGPAASVPPPPYRSPFLLNGLISPQWQRWFNAVYGTLLLGGDAGYVIDAIDTTTPGRLNTITPDLSQGLTHEVVLDQATQITVRNPVPVISVPGVRVTTPSQEFRLIVVQDATGGRPSPLFGDQYAGVVGLVIDPTADTYSVFDFEARVDLKFAVVGFLTGLPVV